MLKTKTKIKPKKKPPQTVEALPDGFGGLLRARSAYDYDPDLADILDPKHLRRMVARASTDSAYAEKIRLMAQAQEDVQVVMARADSSTFCEYVLKTEEGGKDISQAPMHEDMHRLVRQHDRVIIWGSPGTGKSLQMSVGWPLWLLGRDPTLRILVVQGKETLATKMVRTVAQYISQPGVPGYAELHRVFPNLRPARGKGMAVWSSRAITVERGANIRDPSYQALGVHGNILGTRSDVIILDDVLTQENTKTPGRRRDLLDWIKGTLMSRLTPNGIVLLMGNAWHPEDAMHILSRPDDEGHVTWVSARYPIRDANGKTTWGEVWTQEVLEKKARELGPVQAARQLDCLALNDALSRFRRVWFEQCMVPGLWGAQKKSGAPNLMCHRLRDVPKGGRVVLGVDLGVDEEIGMDRTAIGGLMFDAVGGVKLLGIRSGNWRIDDIVEQLIRAYEDWKPSEIYVEAIAGQNFMRQLLRGDLERMGLKLPAGLKSKIQPYHTNAGKRNPTYGIEGIGLELVQKLWQIPCGPGGEVHPEIQQWMMELMSYDPTAHTGDSAMAVYIAWDGLRKRLGLRGLGSVTVSPRATHPVLSEAFEPLTDRRKRDPERQVSMQREIQELSKKDFWAEMRSFMGEAEF